MKRIYLTLDDRLFDAINLEAHKKGVSASLLITSNLEDLYMKQEAINYEELLHTIIEEAQERDSEPFTLSDLPSFSALIIASAEKAHISPGTIRARVGKNFNRAVRNKKAGRIIRATKPNGKLLNKAGVAMYINQKSGGESDDYT